MCQQLVSGIGLDSEGEGCGFGLCAGSGFAVSDPRSDTHRPFVSDEPSEIGGHIESGGVGGAVAVDDTALEADGTADIVLRRGVAGAEKQGRDKSEKESLPGFRG